MVKGSGKPVRPDPLEITGLLHQLPPELVSLRSLSKKAGVMKGKALEELQFVWADPVVKGQSENDYVLVDMLPAWLHRLPSLLIHPARRIRLLTATLHNTFLKVTPIRDQIIFSLTESLDEDQISSIETRSIVMKRIDDLIISNAYYLISDSSNPLLTTYLSTRSDETQRQRCWHRLVSDMAQHPEAFSPNLARLLDVVEENNGQLNSLRPESDELDSLTRQVLVDTLGGSGASHVALLRRVIANPGTSIYIQYISSKF
ncbi:delta 9-fatty acid desaturase [Moniliophthora roreri MCA 2997]|uniref:Delta 9-fatty acid desaturase n=1 Tax=Moniliophthora roreri (strain MCA 2997) TaxID=1381753 RepID=V2WNA0_MONRO|nr:delta 9-fatty acid desaturase [Moniliophthora roreri MCA 2997]